MPALAEEATKENAPSPLWARPLEDPSFDFMTMIPDQGLLVSTVTQKWSITKYDLGYGQFALLDPATGAELWTVPRVSSYDEENEIIALKPHLIAYNDNPKESYYYALRYEDGRKAWRYATNKQTSAKLDGEGRTLVIEERPRPGKKPPVEGDTVDMILRALDAAKGKTLWRVTIKHVPAAGDLPWMAIFGKVVLFSAGKLSAYSLEDGKVLWDNPDVGTMDDDCLAVELSNSELLVSNRAGDLFVIRSNGSTAWRREIGAPLGLCFAAGSKVYIEVSGGEGGRRLVKHDAQSGEVEWSTTLSGEIWSPIATIGSRLAMAVKDFNRHEAHLLFIDAETGIQAMETILPLESLAGPPLGLHLLPGTLALSGEHWVGSFDLASGMASWIHCFDPAEPTQLELYDTQAQGLRAVLAMQGNTGNDNFDIIRGAQAYLSLSIRQNQLQLDRLIRNSNASTLDVGMNINQKRFLDRMASITAFMSITFAIYDQLSAKLTVEEQRRVALPWQIGIGMSASLGKSSFQGDYFVRGVTDSSGGTAMLVVEIATGRWCEIPVTLRQKEAFDPKVEYLFPRMTLDGSRLFVRGTGYDPTLWTATKNKSRTLVPDAVYIVPMPSVLAYEIIPSIFLDPKLYNIAHSSGTAYDRVSIEGGGRARVYTLGRMGIVDEAGHVLLEPRYDRIDKQEDGTAIVVSDGKYGIIDENYQPLIDLVYEYLGPFREDRARVKVGKRYGFIDRIGDFVVKPRFDLAGDFSEGLTWVCEGGKIEFIDRNGNILARTTFDGATLHFHEGLLPVSKRNKFGEEVWGYADASGHLQIAHSFVAALSFVGDFAPAAVNKIGRTRGLAPTYGFINKKGDWVVSPSYDSIGPFHRGLAMVKNEYGYIGYVDTQGREVIPLKYRDGSDFKDDGYALVRLGEDWLNIDAQGHVFPEAPTSRK